MKDRNQEELAAAAAAVCLKNDEQSILSMPLLVLVLVLTMAALFVACCGSGFFDLSYFSLSLNVEVKHNEPYNNNTQEDRDPEGRRGCRKGTGGGSVSP